jgi:preprotein translocase subunit YajC
LFANFVENTRHSYGYVCVFRLISKQKSCLISCIVYLFLIPKPRKSQNKDKNFPLKNIKNPDKIIKNAGHFMAYKRADEIGEIIKEILNKVE